MIRAVAVLALVVTATSSRPPSPTPAKATQDQQNHGQGEQKTTSGNEKKTEHAPLPVVQSKAEIALRNQAPPGTQSHSAAPQQHAVEIWPEATAIAVAVATIVLACLAVWQSYLMLKGLAATTKAADAAKSAADTATRALETLERADVLVENIYFTPPLKESAGAVVVVVFKNYGRSRAEHVTLRCELIVRFLEPPRKPLITRAANIILGAGEHAELEFAQFITGFNSDAIDDVNIGEAPLDVIAKIAYADVFGKTYETEAIGWYRPVRGTFQLTHHDASKKEEGG
ncbi:MAG TPA: hypothetical protein VGQ65_00970 [Thermoanaerobaculia bacterium]|jgi:hypothetical protein|nr:hypothetical protein [Thermoanaerobaculia bacterium]